MLLFNTQFRNVAQQLIESRSVSNQKLQRCLFDILKHNVLCSIATIAPDNRAYINTAYFCYSKDLELYFLSHPDSMHCRNLSTNPSIAITVFSSNQNWTEPGRGIQLFGTCKQATGSQLKKATKLYTNRFKAYQSWSKTLEAKDISRQYALYRVEVTSFKVHDEKTFGDGTFVYGEIKSH